jgi:hypothetical protein
MSSNGLRQKLYYVARSLPGSSPLVFVRSQSCGVPQASLSTRFPQSDRLQDFETKLKPILPLAALPFGLS